MNTSPRKFWVTQAFSTTQALAEAIDSYAYRHRISRSAVIRQAIEELLDREAGK